MKLGKKWDKTHIKCRVLFGQKYGENIISKYGDYLGRTWDKTQSKYGDSLGVNIGQNLKYNGVYLW